MKKLLMMVSLLFRGLSVEASEDGQPEPISTHPTEAPIASGWSLTGKIFVAINYSYLDLLLPSKYGATLEFLGNDHRSTGIEYLRGSLTVPAFVSDLGGFKEERWSLTRRHLADGRSFHLFWLLAYNWVEARLGSSLLESLPGSTGSTVELISSETIGLGGGLGNRWTLGNGVLAGFDWFVWTQPLLTLNSRNAAADMIQSKEDRDNVKRAMDWIGRFPRFSIAKLQVGYAF